MRLRLPSDIMQLVFRDIEQTISEGALSEVEQAGGRSLVQWSVIVLDNQSIVRTADRQKRLGVCGAEYMWTEAQGQRVPPSASASLSQQLSA